MKLIIWAQQSCLLIKPPTGRVSLGLTSGTWDFLLTRSMTCHRVVTTTCHLFPFLWMVRGWWLTICLLPPAVTTVTITSPTTSAVLILVIWPARVILFLFIRDFHPLLCILLILRMKIMDSILHDIPRIHGFLQAARYTLQGYSTSGVVSRTRAVHGVWESKSQCNRSTEHLNADEKVLVASRYCTDSSRLLAVVWIDWTYGPSMLENSQQHTCNQIADKKTTLKK